MQKWILSILIICGLVYSCRSQQGLSISYSPSQLIKLGNRNSFDIPKSPYVSHISYAFSSSLTSQWQQYWRYPTVSIKAFFIDLDQPKILGYAYGVIPNLTYKVINSRNDRIGLYASFGSGLALTTHTYHKILNPTNNAIGSHLNNLTHFEIDVQAKISNYSAKIGYQLTHISNARTATPNTGFNLHGWQITISRNSQKKKPHFIEKNQPDTIDHWGGDFAVGYGHSEYTFTGGAKYGSYWASGGLKYLWSKYISTTLGAEYEYNESIYQFYNQDFDSVDIATKKATQTSMFLAQRLRFGYIAIRFQGGIYLPYPDIERTRHPNYLRIGIDIHPFNGKYHVDPYIGISLKSHKAVAQYLGIYSGLLF